MITWELLRKDYPHIPASEFLQLVKEIRDQLQGKSLRELDEGTLDVIRLLFAEREQEALVAHESEKALIQDIGERITASMLHRQLEITVPKGIDLEHAQAFLAYGLIFPSSSRTFAGENYLPREHIRRNVRGKLLHRFDIEKLSTVEGYLLRHGVIARQGKAAAVIYSLNTLEGAKGVTQEGKEAIKVIKCFMHQHRPK